mgnify:CR=1 FL=1
MIYSSESDFNNYNWKDKTVNCISISWVPYRCDSINLMQSNCCDNYSSIIIIHVVLIEINNNLIKQKMLWICLNFSILMLK